MTRTPLEIACALGSTHPKGWTVTQFIASSGFDTHFALAAIDRMQRKRLIKRRGRKHIRYVTLAKQLDLGFDAALEALEQGGRDA